MMNGNELRKEKLELRDTLGKKQMEEKSEIIKESLLQLGEVKRTLNIFIYVSFRSEVKTVSTIEEFLKQSKKVTVPITYVKEKRLDAILIQDISKDLVPGYCGIPEPKKDLCMSNIVRPDDIDVIIDLDVKFHEALISAANNEVLLKFYKVVSGQMLVYWNYIYSRVPKLEKSFYEHNDLIKAISDDNKKLAEEHLVYHINQSREFALKLAEEL